MLLPVLCLFALLIRCTVTPVALGGSDNPDFIVIGSVVDTSGQPAQNTVVTIVPASYNPVTDTVPATAITDTTDAFGTYCVSVKQKGVYTVQAVHLLQRTTLLVTDISVAGDTTLVEDAALAAPGTIRMHLPSSSINASTGYIYIPGTMLFVLLNNRIETLVIDSVPAGTLPSLAYVATDTAVSVSLRYNVPIAPGDTTDVWNTSWKYCRQIILNTTVSGANINGDVADFPVLIRLHAANFDFSQAKPGGADIRFTKADNTFLPYEIERWDVAGRQAEIWVKIDTIYGNDSTQSITMYWGNPAAVDSSNGIAVFDTATGFQGVWHLNEAGNDPALDATANRFMGTAYRMANDAPVAGKIGNARAFDSSYITMPNTANSKLNFPENGDFSISAWVYVDMIGTVSNEYDCHVIVSKGFKQYFLWLTNFVPDLLNKPSWEFSTFSATANWQMSHTPATEKQWVLLTGVRRDTSQYLFYNGEIVAGTSAVYDHNTTRDISDIVSIGRFMQEVNFPGQFGYCYFKGLIDEVTISGVARNQDWVKLCYMNQRSDDKLIQFK